MGGWHVGARVLVVYDLNQRGPRKKWASVTKVGRRWIEFLKDGFLSRNKTDRFDAETLQVDGGAYSSPGKVWLSECEYDHQTELAKAWSDLVRRLSHTPPPSMTMEALNRFASDCGLTAQ